ncbi:hypothetical protein T01_2806 [Trichinella spiralis]|uniref:Uncharacterized protein n=1 Tax=Trichinella spiralis TaxID=6334 RepID=A0A0V1BPM0_TRISP|nr:hypothetical protein T01_2806 [Trichinella spiralis]
MENELPKFCSFLKIASAITLILSLYIFCLWLDASVTFFGNVLEFIPLRRLWLYQVVKLVPEFRIRYLTLSLHVFTVHCFTVLKLRWIKCVIPPVCPALCHVQKRR